MSKELRELLSRLETMKAEVRSFMGADKMEDAEKRMNDVRELQKKVDLQRALEETEERGLWGGNERNGDPEQRNEKELENEYRSIFLQAVRRREVSSDQRSVIKEYEKRAVMHEGGATGQTDGDSGLIVPQDIQTQIHELTRQFNDLSQYVHVEEVTTLSGSRVLEKLGTMTPFAEIEEYGVIPNMENPKFEKVSYQARKRGGILPLTNELIADSDQNLINYIKRWIAQKSVVTRNMLITGMLNGFDKVAFDSLDDVKRAMNISLDPAILDNSIILTNQDGFNWLDEQKDSNGRYLLQDDITQAGRKLFKGRPVAVSSNRFLPSVGSKAPFIAGDLEQAIILFSRLFYELASTREGGDAWKRDTTDLRVLMREDIKTWDEEAVVYGQLDLAAVPEA